MIADPSLMLTPQLAHYATCQQSIGLQPLFIEQVLRPFPQHPA
jgi:hypothetical protein